MITVLVRQPKFDDLKVRERFVKFLAYTIDGSGDATYHLTNVSDPFQYSIGHGNDWRVKFNENSFSLTYRYQCNTIKAEEALAGWLTHQLNAQVIKEESLNDAGE